MTLLPALEPLPDEVVVASLILQRGREAWGLVRGSVLVVPHQAGEANWFDWQVRHGIRPLVQTDPPGPEYQVLAGTYLAGRAVMSLEQADDWVRRLAEDGVGAAVGPLPDFGAVLDRPIAPVQVSPHLDTPGSTFVCSAVRPAVGYILTSADARARIVEEPVDDLQTVQGMIWEGEGAPG